MTYRSFPGESVEELKDTTLIRMKLKAHFTRISEEEIV
jgi:hypothetical protein